MSTPHDNTREDDALDALIVAAFRQDETECEGITRLRSREPILSEEDCAALDALGDDLAARIVLGAWAPTGTDCPGSQTDEAELAAAMNRGEEDGELSDEAREEMDRKTRELEDREKNGRLDDQPGD
jgi:hypothetical protein